MKKILTIVFILNLLFIRVEASNDAHVVSDGTLVIVRSSSTLGAFVINNQRSNPTEQAKYEWLLFEKSENSNKWVTTEKGTGRTGDLPKSFWFLNYVTLDPIKFGPFKLYWSSKGLGNGWVYFSYFNTIMPKDYCITENETLGNTFEITKKCFVN